MPKRKSPKMKFAISYLMETFLFLLSHIEVAI